jgi:cell wall assembly regulator SMI1
VTDQPALISTWTTYVRWLEQHAPAAFANLAPGADDVAIAALERAIGQAVAQELASLLRLNDGQVDPFGCTVLPGL